MMQYIAISVPGLTYDISIQILNPGSGATTHEVSHIVILLATKTIKLT